MHQLFRNPPEGVETDPRWSSVIILSAADREILHALDPAFVNAIIFKPFDITQFAPTSAGPPATAAAIGVTVAWSAWRD